MIDSPDYEVLDELGRGGMGVVFRARERSTGRLVALKVIQGTLTPTRRERFLREGQTTANLQHAGIVKVHAFGEFEGCPFLAYELVQDCRSLTDVAADADLDHQVRLVRDVAEALGYAHANGVVHRDVKPANLLVDQTGSVKVADFGLALAEGVDRLTRTGELLGTPHYMSPEAFAGKKEIGPQSDVWSLGVILFQVVSGELPFEGAQMVDLALAVARGRAPNLSSVAPHVPADLAAICARALEPEPEGRYPDAAELAADLVAFLAGKPPPGVERAKRRTWPVMAGAVLLTCGLVLGGLLAGRAESPTTIATSHAPAPDPRLSLEDRLGRARSALRAGRTQDALTILGSAPGREAHRVRGLAALLCNRSAQARLELSAVGATPLLDLDRARRALVSLTESSTERPDLLGGDILKLRGSCEETLDLAERVLPKWGDFKALVSEQVQDALAAAVFADLWLGEPARPQQLLAICRRAIALDPDQPAAHRCRLTTAWVHMCRGTIDPRDPRLRDNVIADPAGWAAPLTDEIQRAAYGLWFLVQPDPERIAAGRRCVDAMTPPKLLSKPPSAFLRRMVLALLCRELRKLAVADLASGRADRIRSARSRLDLALHYGGQNLATPSQSGGSLDLLEVALARIVAGDHEIARRLATQIAHTYIRDILLAEIDLAEGKQVDAVRRIRPHAASNTFVLQAALIGIHSELLSGNVASARRNLAAVQGWIKTNAHTQILIEWRTLENTRDLIEGKGWWPGKRR